MPSAIVDINGITTIDTQIIPNILTSVVDMPKSLENTLLNNADLRNKIINFTQKLKIAMSYRSKGQCGCYSIVPWRCALPKKCITFDQKADLFYFLAIPTSKFNKILTVAVNINKNLKLHLHYIVNNRIFCPKYKIVNSENKTVPYFNQLINNHYVQNNLMRAMISGPYGLPTEYKLIRV